MLILLSVFDNLTSILHTLFRIGSVVWLPVISKVEKSAIEADKDGLHVEKA